MIYFSEGQINRKQCRKSTMGTTYYVENTIHLVFRILTSEYFKIKLSDYINLHINTTQTPIHRQHTNFCYQLKLVLQLYHNTVAFSTFCPLQTHLWILKLHKYHQVFNYCTIQDQLIHATHCFLCKLQFMLQENNI